MEIIEVKEESRGVTKDNITKLASVGSQSWLGTIHRRKHLVSFIGFNMVRIIKSLLGDVNTIRKINYRARKVIIGFIIFIFRYCLL